MRPDPGFAVRSGRLIHLRPRILPHRLVHLAESQHGGAVLADLVVHFRLTVIVKHFETQRYILVVILKSFTAGTSRESRVQIIP